MLQDAVIASVAGLLRANKDRWLSWEFLLAHTRRDQAPLILKVLVAAGVVRQRFQPTPIGEQLVNPETGSIQQEYQWI